MASVVRLPARQLVLAMTLTALLPVTGCGGGGGGGTAAATPATPQGQGIVSFDQARPRAAFASGSTGFTLSRALLDGERLVCNLPDAASVACGASGQRGQLAYTGLAVGSHRMTVELRDTAGKLVDNASATLELRRPEVVVYSATPGGIAAALAAARAGREVLLIEPTAHVGGMMSGGLTKTDIGDNGYDVIGGIAREFLDATLAAERARGRCTSARPCDSISDFEPQVAEQVFDRLLAAETKLVVERSARFTGATRNGTAITGIATTRGSVGGAIFIDASYEGDLMAGAGASHAIGREARVMAASGDSEALALQEDTAGFIKVARPLGRMIDPYAVAGDAASGLLAYVEPKPATAPVAGDGDGHVMAYGYRLCVTDDPNDRVPFTRPEGYDAAMFEPAVRQALGLIADGVDPAAQYFRPYRTVPSATDGYYKYDLNGGTTYSIDMTAPGLNQSWTTTDEAGRERIRAAYKVWTAGLLWTWQTDTRLGALNAKVARFGLCADEFTDNGNWPYQLYVRESRRLRGEYVLNENDVRQNGRRPAVSDVVGMGAYPFDSHNVRYVARALLVPDRSRRADTITIDGYQSETLPNGPYPIGWRSLLPRASEVTNLLVVSTPSVSRQAFLSVRIEPTYMILGQSAGIGAAETLRAGTTLHALPYATLRPLLVAAGQRLSWR
ncbi:FAD-dependent oxidoreductase [Derxia gummosa]|uniref:FAD-dependent oxidoreductase n=1 Tax=Derxia gummosa DSM 723 TaxID=1121388 RepID=A0A8B6XD34_9BURK|nr:FAD-dependent oxidoreductase [Derxia gummosa]